MVFDKDRQPLERFDTCILRFLGLPNCQGHFFVEESPQIREHNDLKDESW